MDTIKRMIFSSKRKTFNDRAKSIEDPWVIANVKAIEDLILFAKFKGNCKRDAIAFMERYRDEYRCAIMARDDTILYRNNGN